ncbi:Na/Pi cotransporter family protein, partial [candidate division WOR-3 bacterium]|nr:Na/Pi cotransporter family protein [candidate division WOR-3 bacterium]
KNNNALRKMVIKRDNEIDKLQEELTAYTSRLLGKELGERESNNCISILRIMSEIEHIGDIISKSLMAYAEKKIKQSYFFSDEGFNEIQEYHQTVLFNIEEIGAALSTMDKELAMEILESQEDSTENLRKFRESHLMRLKVGMRESIDTSTLHLDILNDFDRINLHVYNIAKAIIGKL